MVSYFGMSEKIGNISFYDSSGQSDYGFTKPYSERTAELIDQEVKKIISESFDRAVELLEKHKEGLTELAELLLEKEVIFSEDVEKIFGKRKADIIKEQKEREKETQTGNETAPEVSEPEKEISDPSPSDAQETGNSDGPETGGDQGSVRQEGNNTASQQSAKD